MVKHSVDVNTNVIYLLVIKTWHNDSTNKQNANPERTISSVHVSIIIGSIDITNIRKIHQPNAWKLYAL